MAYTFKTDTTELYRWIRDEVEFPGVIKRGKRGIQARRVQEWLTLHGLSLVIDEDFGPVTERTIAEFQSDAGLPDTGEVDEETWSALVADMLDVLKVPEDLSDNPRDIILQFAEIHLLALPVEVGGQNAGPWVRLYMKGNEGVSWPWCAGFMTFLMEQTYEVLDRPTPLEGSFSCDWFAASAKAQDLFVAEADAMVNTIPSGSFFLVRRTPTDWTHIGLVTAAEPLLFHTIEGNTNDEGSREGFEVCARRRGYASKDFVILPD